MANLDIGPAYAEVGQIVAEDVRGVPEGAFLYAEVEDGVVGCGIFKDIGDRVLYRSCSRKLVSKLYDNWQMEEIHKRWAAISYTIKAGTFSATFQYPDEFIMGEDMADRRPRVLKEKYGDKPVDYSDP